ncbi:MAG: hypothetical protein ACO1SV_27500 [Fimbriimonas sp.]
MKRGQRVVAKHLIKFEVVGGRRGEHYVIFEGEEGVVNKAIPGIKQHIVHFDRSRSYRGPVYVYCPNSAIKRIRETQARGECL